MKRIYIKYILPTRTIYQKINSLNNKINNINFFIDLNSVAKGFYNKETIFEEINNFITSNKERKPRALLEELSSFLNEVYSKFTNFNINFIIFYDLGQNTQNKIISEQYKINRTALRDFLGDDEKELHREIRKYYFDKIPEKFTIKNLSKVVYIPQYETDFIPYFTIKYNILNSQQNDTINLIISSDKDLLQCCQFTNTFQSINIYKKSERKMEFKLYDNQTAIEYIYKNFRIGDLDAKYIPLLLSLAGDKSDGIDGVYNFGVSKAIKLIRVHDLPYKINSDTQFPKEIAQYKDTILKNYKMIDFDSQISRIPEVLKNKLVDILNF